MNNWPGFSDLRVAARSLWHAKSSSAAILLTLAIAIGGTAAMFSVVHAVLVAPLPYANADRLVRVWERHVPRNRDRNVAAPANFMEWQDRATSLQDLTAYSPGTVSITGDGAPERVMSLASTPRLFALLGTVAAAGRILEPQDATPNAERVVMIGWGLWQRRYSGDRSIVNRSLTLNGSPARVVGILPRGFRLMGADYDVWAVLALPESARTPRGRSLQVLARLASGATLADAQAEMDVIAGRMEQRWPDFNAGWRIRVVGAREDLVGGLARPLWMLLGAVALVLLVGGANAANLLLARAAERRREFEVRAALGASRLRLLGQLATEGLVLGALGTAAGLAAAVVALQMLTAVAGPAFGVPRLENAGLGWPVLLAGAGLLVLTTVVFALAPGWLATRATSGPMPTGATRVWTGGRVERRLRVSLVVAQVAFAVLLVISAGLVGRSLSRLVAVSPGFDAEDVLTLTVSLPGSAYSDDQQVAFFARAAESLRGISGVRQVGAISWLPFAGPGGGTSFDVAGRTPLPAADRPVADIRPIDAEYFETMRIPLRRGRTFTADEIRTRARVAVINEDLARRVFVNEDPIGKRLQVNWNEGLDEIVGIVGDVKLGDLGGDVRSQIYFPQGTANVGFVTYVVRSQTDDESALTRPAMAAIQSLDPNLPVRDVKPMSAWVDQSVAAPRMAAWLVGAFGTLALVLAVIGVAGLQIASVEARRIEFGIRQALGATPGMIRRQVIGQAAVHIGLGLAAGIGAALVATRLMADLLFDTPATEPAVYGSTAVLIVTLGLLACVGAIRRATRTHPADVLR